MKKAERCKKEINIQYECKLCQELFWDRKLARNHIEGLLKKYREKWHSLKGAVNSYE